MTEQNWEDGYGSSVGYSIAVESHSLDEQRLPLSGIPQPDPSPVDPGDGPGWYLNRSHCGVGPGSVEAWVTEQSWEDGYERFAGYSIAVEPPKLNKQGLPLSGGSQPDPSPVPSGQSRVVLAAHSLRSASWER